MFVVLPVYICTFYFVSAFVRIHVFIFYTYIFIDSSVSAEFLSAAQKTVIHVRTQETNFQQHKFHIRHIVVQLVEPSPPHPHGDSASGPPNLCALATARRQCITDVVSLYLWTFAQHSEVVDVGQIGAECRQTGRLQTAASKQTSSAKTLACKLP